mgnify:CR=1 FL=1
MIDQKKVIKGFEICLSGGLPQRCRECPYHGQTCNLALMRDALSLLEEHEPKHGHWKVLENCSNAGVYCSECNTKMFDSYPMRKKMSQFCGHCGAEMSKDVERL